MHHQARSRAPLAVARFLSNGGLPLFLSFEVHRVDTHFPEEHKYKLSVGYRRITGIAMLVDVPTIRILRSRVGNLKGPSAGTARSIETMQRSFHILSLPGVTGDKDRFTPYDRA